jgi:hypothetical protein
MFFALGGLPLLGFGSKGFIEVTPLELESYYRIAGELVCNFVTWCLVDSMKSVAKLYSG